MELDDKELEKLKELVPYKILSPTPQEIIAEIERLNNIINELEKDLYKIRELTFNKYNSNEWNNCLSFNDDILPVINRLKELKGVEKE